MIKYNKRIRNLIQIRFKTWPQHAIRYKTTARSTQQKSFMKNSVPVPVPVP